MGWFLLLLENLTGSDSTISTTILKITYGINIEDEDNKLIDKVNTALDGITQVMVPGRFAVDYIPLLEHVPAWFPGAGFHAEFERLRNQLGHFKRLLFTSRSTETVC